MRLELPIQVSLAALLLALPTPAAAQEPAPTPPAEPPVERPVERPVEQPADPAADAPRQPGAEQPATTPADDEPAEPRRRRGGRRRGPPTTVVRAGHVHPVAGPDLVDGVVVFQGQRITAVGAFGDTAVPEGATVVHFPDAHLYPGLIDADTTAFLDDEARRDRSLDAAAEVALQLVRRQDREDQLVLAGITTAYVRSQAGSGWNGVGAIVRPKASGFTVYPERDRAAVELRFAWPQPTHPLDRQKAIDAAFKAFDGLDDYRKKLDEHQEALEKYEKEFADYLAFHEKKKAKDGDGKADDQAKPDGDAPGPKQDGEAAEDKPAGDGPPRRGRGRRPRPNPDDPPPDRPKPDGGIAGSEQDPKPQEPKPQEPKNQDPKPQDPKLQGEGKPAEAKADKGPERPKYPKAPDRDPQKDTLLDVLDGKLPLRAEVRNADEIRRTLQQAREHKVPLLVLEDALGAGAAATELARAAVPCVLTGLWPEPLSTPLDADDPAALPAALQAAGVPFALATGDGRRAQALPLLAAVAVGGGLDEAAALRAVTLTPAEILGLQQDTGSLQRGKLADLVVTDRPLFLSDSRVLAVWSAGARQDQQDPATAAPAEDTRR